MLYKYKPNTHVIDYENNKEIFKFDSKGEFQTDNEKIIKFMKENKGFIRCENNAYTCKNCGKVFDNKGLLLAHYRTHKRNR
jgi:hypothetical protein